MANFRNIPTGKAGMQSAQGIESSTQVAGEPFMKNIYPGICLFGDEDTPQTFTQGAVNSFGERIITLSGTPAIQYIHNDGFVNPSASATVMSNNTAPFINVLCQNTGAPWRILRVIDDTTIVIADPYESFPASADCWFAKSELYPNKKVILHSDFPFQVFTMGGAIAEPSFDGASYYIELGDGINPLDVIGLDSGTFSSVIK